MIMIDFYDYQYGFRKNHSTATCLSLLNDNILKGFYIYRELICVTFSPENLVKSTNLDR